MEQATGASPQDHEKPTVIAAKKSPETLEYVMKKRSVSIKNLSTPGPSRAEIDIILKAASHVPDHGKLCPWYFVVFDGEARSQAGEILEWAWRDVEPKAAPAKMALERERFMRAPVVIAVISKMRDSKHPEWEQILSAGAACQNLTLAANALGYGTNWVTEWYSYNDTFRSELGVAEGENIAGFIYIGTPSAMPEERERPDLAQIVTYWEPGTRLKKGERG